MITRRERDTTKMKLIIACLVIDKKKKQNHERNVFEDRERTKQTDMQTSRQTDIQTENYILLQNFAIAFFSNSLFCH